MLNKKISYSLLQKILIKNKAIKLSKKIIKRNNFESIIEKWKIKNLTFYVKHFKRYNVCYILYLEEMTGDVVKIYELVATFKAIKRIMLSFNNIPLISRYYWISSKKDIYKRIYE